MRLSVVPGPFRLALFALLLATRTATACDCRQVTLEEARRLSHAVFVGRVVAFRPFDSIDLVPLERFKGARADTIHVWIPGSDCDYFLPPLEPKPGDRFLLFARRERRRFEVNRCLGSGPVELRQDEIARLRSGKPGR